MSEAPVKRRRPPSEMIDHLQRWVHVAQALQEGLRGHPFHWRGVDAQHGFPLLQAMGLTLVTTSRIKKLGYRLVRDAQPVGTVYYGAPISRTAAVYLLEAQCEPIERDQYTNIGIEQERL